MLPCSRLPHHIPSQRRNPPQHVVPMSPGRPAPRLADRSDAGRSARAAGIVTPPWTPCPPRSPSRLDAGDRPEPLQLALPSRSRTGGVQARRSAGASSPSGTTRSPVRRSRPATVQPPGRHRPHQVRRRSGHRICRRQVRATPLRPPRPEQPCRTTCRRPPP